MFRLLLRALFLFFIFVSVVPAKNADTVRVYGDSIANSKVLFEGKWIYKAGDDSLWKAASLDCSDWDTTSCSLTNAKWNGICWLRTTFVIDSALRKQTVAFRVSHCGASEIYLNGKLVKKFGVVGNTLAGEELYQPQDIPFPVELDTALIYNLAIRYSNQNSVANKTWFKQWFGSPGLSFDIAGLEGVIKRSIDSGRINFLVNFILVGLFFSLSLLYFFLFLFYELKKENLSYSLFNLLIALLFTCQMVAQLIYTNINLMAFLQIAHSVALLFTFVTYLGFLYSIFYDKMQKLFIIFFVFTSCVAGCMLVPSLYLLSDKGLVVVVVGSVIESLRIIYVAIKNKKPNAWIIGAGVLVFVLFILVIVVLSVMGQRVSSMYGLILFLVGLFSLPITMSIYLAKQMSVTNKNLEQQLITVKELSQKEIESQMKQAQLQLEAEKTRAEKADAELRAQAAELQAKAYEAERRALEAENERKTKELEEARSLQLSMLPKELPQIPHLDIAVYMKTATEVGGDYYDFRVAMDGTLTVVAGDATGHGMKAGTMVSVAKSLFNSYASNHDILFVFGEMARCIKQMNFEQLAMCMTMLKISGNKLRVSSAGMPPMLFYKNSLNLLEEHLIKGMPLGTMVKFPYEVKEIELGKGDTILVMSDGFPEMQNSKGEIFGYQRVQDSFAAAALKEPEEIIEHLKAEEAKWTKGSSPDDDITFVVIKVK